MTFIEADRLRERLQILNPESIYEVHKTELPSPGVSPFYVKRVPEPKRKKGRRA